MISFTFDGIQHRCIVSFNGFHFLAMRRNTTRVGIQGFYPVLAVKPGKYLEHGKHWSTNGQHTEEPMKSQMQRFCAAHMHANAKIARAKPAAAMAPKGDADIPK